MRIVRFRDDAGRTGYGCRQTDGRITLAEGDWQAGFTDSGTPVTVAKLLAPVKPTAILCIGLNYRDHARETGQEPPARPVLFFKNPAAVAHPDDPVVIPACCREPAQVDFEAELALVIGRPAKDLSAGEAMSAVAGFTAANDVSARWWQMNGGGGQWNRGKSFDTFCPLGPWVVTPDELPHWQNAGIRLTLNGTVMQAGSTADMLFPVRELVAFLSQDTTLLPGTVILTGTPAGVGFSRRPPVFLAPGDRMSVEIEGLGRLSNPVAAG